MSIILRTSAGDLPVLDGGLVLPLRGPWSATVTCNAADNLTPPEELSAAELRLTREGGAVDVFTGAVRRSASSFGRLVTTIVGGAGKFLAEIPPRDHQPGTSTIPAGLIARSICDDAGERLDAGVEDALDALTVRRWSRMRGSALEALDLLADVLGVGWRVLPSGRVRLGAETWPEVEPDALNRKLEPDPDDGSVAWATDGAPILAGQTLEGRRLIEVRYALTAGAPRATVRAAVSGDPPHVPRLDLYRQIYACTVVAQDATSHELELLPDDERLGDTTRPLRGIPLRVGIPGARCTVPAGARVVLAFESADPRKPFAFGLDEATAAAATKRFALLDDVVKGGTLSVVAPLGGGPCTLTWTPFGGAPLVGPTATIDGYVYGPGHKHAKGEPA